MLIDDAPRTARRTRTKQTGFFLIAAVPAGTYTVRITAEGFSQLERTNVVFRAGDKRHLPDLVLQAGLTSEVVSLTGEMDTVTPVDSGEQPTTITAEQMQNLAIVGTSAAQLIKIIPGMAPTGAAWRTWWLSAARTSVPCGAPTRRSPPSGSMPACTEQHHSMGPSRPARPGASEAVA